jgi:hypothetical protein
MLVEALDTNNNVLLFAVAVAVAIDIFPFMVVCDFVNINNHLQQLATGRDDEQYIFSPFQQTSRKQKTCERSNERNGRAAFAN